MEPPRRLPIGQYRITGFTTSDDLGPDAVIHILQHAAEAAGVTFRVEGWERIGNDKRPAAAQLRELADAVAELGGDRFQRTGSGLTTEAHRIARELRAHAGGAAAAPARTPDLARIARIVSASIDHDENDSDYRKSLDTIRHIATGGARGHDWGKGHPNGDEAPVPAGAVPDPVARVDAAVNIIKTARAVLLAEESPEDDAVTAALAQLRAAVMAYDRAPRR